MDCGCAPKSCIIQNNSEGQPEFAEVQYYFQMVVKNETKTLALVSKYPPDASLLEESFEMLWRFNMPGPQELLFVKDIISVVSIPPLPRGKPGVYFLCEKPGQDVVQWGDHEEGMMDEENFDNGDE